MANTWFSITVELVEGRDLSFWPRPGRIFAASPAHTFGDLSRAIDPAFARWDLSHLHEFRMANETSIGEIDPRLDQDEDLVDEEATKLKILSPGDRFLYVYDLGDGCHHLCTVAKEKIDPVQTLGIAPTEPMAYWGWGEMPDQYGRRWSGDDGESFLPADPKKADLPPFFPWWGEGASDYPN